MTNIYRLISDNKEGYSENDNPKHWMIDSGDSKYIYR